MKYNEKPQGEKKSSRLAALITAIILLCLVLAGGAFVLSGRPSSRGADLNKGDLSSSSGSGGEDRGFAGRLYDWLGIETIMTILRPQESGIIAGGIDSADSTAGVKASVDESAAADETDLVSAADTAAGSDSSTADSAEVKAADTDQAAAGSTQSKAARRIKTQRKTPAPKARMKRSPNPSAKTRKMPPPGTKSQRIPSQSCRKNMSKHGRSGTCGISR